jgi:murein DD-endopeptidase MepM/ murein hydrolase activator NlpD
LGLSGLAPITAQAEDESMSLADVRQALDDLETQSQDIAARQATAQEKLKQAQDKLDTTRTQIAAQKTELVQLNAQLSQIALQQYQDRGLNTTAYIMTSSSTDDLLGYLAVMQQVTDTSNSLITTLQLAQSALADLERGEQAATDSIAAERASLDALASENQASTASMSALLKKMTRLAAQQAAAQAAQSALSNTTVANGVADPTTVVPNPSSSYISPLASYTVTSPFGMRVHPISGAWKFHDGLDMSARCGTPVMAPTNAYVIDYYWDGGYGNRMVLDNGIVNGHHVVTAYNHLSGSVAKPNSAATQGQTIALVGTSGASTGCHLHYMVWIDGQLVDPTPYV